jgi:hypothetical protein
MRSRQATDVVRVFCLHGSTPCLAHLGSPDHHSPQYLICAVRKRLSFAGYPLSTVPETEKASTFKPMNSRTTRTRSERRSLMAPNARLHYEPSQDVERRPAATQDEEVHAVAR